MSHSKNTSDAASRASADGAWTSSESIHDWDAETRVMPPEYCRQLLAISRQLQHGK